jgi:DNA-binding NtrC family response regulator
VTEGPTVPHRVSGLPVRTLRIEVVRGPDSGKTFLAQGGSASIGTAPGNDLVLTDETVSRYHVELLRDGDRVLVVDHGSTNGVLSGTMLIDRARITPGTILSLGKTQVKIDDGETVTVELSDKESLGRLRGRSPPMRQMIAHLERAARTDASMLLLGETGTGKEVIARAVHEASPRADKPFEIVDCGSLLPTLIASELFGHERGAFTGAEKQHVGAFERAHGGTLFLDEVGELPPAVQSTLLGALERRRFRRLGGNHEISVDVRVISATNRDLRVEVNSGRFRQDLYFRLAVVLIRVPPLRERVGDIPILVEHFLREVGDERAADDVIPPAAMQSLKAHHWPGNVRELRNLVEATLAIGEAPRIDRDPEAPNANATFLTVPVEALLDSTYKDARQQLLHDFETVYLKTLLDRSDGNVSSAARRARMDRSYLIQMLKRHGIR